MATKEEWEILTEKVEQYDEMGFPSLNGEYDINGWPLLVLNKEVRIARARVIVGGANEYDTKKTS